MHKHTVEVQVGTQTLSFETGYMAKQAAGAVVVRTGDTMVLSTVCDGDPRPGQGFFPLMADYREKAYAAGRIPGNFFKREARPSDHETLTSRLTDRPLRPLFPEGYMRDTNCSSFVISFDQVNESDVMSMNGVSAALHISKIPWNGPIGAVRIGLINDAFVVNPEIEQRKDSALDLVVAGTADGIAMVEAGASEISEERMVEALLLAHAEIKKICAAIEELRVKAGVEKVPFVPAEPNPWIAKILKSHRGDIEAALGIRAKHARYDAISACKSAVVAALAGDDEELANEIKAAFSGAKDEVFRELILQGKRVDGRDTKTVRPIVIDLDVLPRAHGSAIFTRGETQGLLVCTLGTADDEQMIDGLKPKYFEKFLLHYNFPGFSVGETGGRPGPGRREIGHGALARRALLPVLPDNDVWPYTIRIVSDITESNGSSSMASVCGGSLSMMAAGVPIKAPVAGIAMGLVKEGDRYAVLTDILGDEDHYGDMDFKVCGTSKGITALQMDIKIDGLSPELMSEALAQARDGRLHILEVMNEHIATHRDQLSPFAPQIVQVQIDPEFIGKIIGKGGETIRRIQEETGAKLNVDDDGIITIASPDMKSIEAAKGWISDLTEAPEEGKTYRGTVTSVKDFGAFVEFLPSTEGLVHISEWTWERVDTMESVAKAGQQIEVKLLEVDPRTGKFRLSRKALLEKPEGYVEPERAPRREDGDRPPRRDGDRPPRRDGDRRPPRRS
ncbi:MAG: polyribonucleotide nucleotidyltransferase [Planctomycetota bacterium]|nr:MAG: polyribonucleotide nucleotidyltransferase [Planctomycetota bacterium]